jgi:hypothetical protein
LKNAMIKGFIQWRRYEFVRRVGSKPIVSGG